MFLSQHLMTHPSSRLETDLLVKSVMQSSKHLSTSFEYIYDEGDSERRFRYGHG